MAKAGAMMGQPDTGATAGPGRLTPLTGFGPNPGALLGHVYVPEDLPPSAPLVVVLHGCTQTAAGYDAGSGWSQLADREGFAVLFPEQTRTNNPNLCFNWFASEDIARSGGEADSIAQMTEAMIATHGLDPARVFITGLSAGGAMTMTMLATRPDLYAGGAVIGGLAFGTAIGVAQAFDRMRGHGEPSDAALVETVQRAARGHDGRWPTLSIWHGDADATVSVSNADMIGRQWRGLHGIAEDAGREDRIGKAIHRVWTDSEGRAAVEEWIVPGMGHGTPIDPTASDGIGAAAPFMLDVGIASTTLIAAGWGLVEPERGARTATKTAPKTATKTAIRMTPATKKAKPAANPVQDAIENALRAAGLMR